MSSNAAMIRLQRSMQLLLPANTLRGIVSFYAIIHLTRAEAAMTLQEFARVLQPGGFLLLAFHGGEGEIHSFGMVWTARGCRCNALRGRGNGAVCAPGGIVRRGGSRAAPLCF